MPKLYLSLAFHNHQPVGNFDWVFAEAYQKAYLPMLEAIENHPGIRLAIHNTGPLLDWLLERRPDYINRLKKLAASGQVEIMAGAYYEPILVSLSDRDKAGQLNKMVSAIKTHLAYTPTGGWLAERVWEPHLPKPLAEAGIKYIIVDDTHLRYAGIPDQAQFGYYITEEQGYPLKLFGSNKYLRYNIPWADVEEVIAGLRHMAEEDSQSPIPRVAVMGDDGEKFGLWPQTYDHCWTNGWVDDFFAALEQNRDWIETIPPGEYASRFGALGQTFVTAASYDEMTEWALPASQTAAIVKIKRKLQKKGQDAILTFVKGGLWRGFIAKYPEVNQMHKKALAVSRKVHAMPASLDKERALEHLWAAQCNCGYWHGLFGGIYLFHIRGANYRHLISAESLADEAIKGSGWIEADKTDYDVDGYDELILSNEKQWICFDLQEGGMATEWDFRPAPYNLLNTVARREEAYHRELRKAAAKGRIHLANDDAETQNAHERGVMVKELGLENRIFYDWYRRGAFIDRFFPESLSVTDFVQIPPHGFDDFVKQPYEGVVEVRDGVGIAKLWRTAGIRGNDSLLIPVKLTKSFSLAANSAVLAVTYEIQNMGEGSLQCRFGVENNFGLEGGQDPLTYFEGLPDNAGNRQYPGGIGSATDIAQFSLVSDIITVRSKIMIEASMPADVWFYPFESVTNSEGGYEANYQGSCLMLHWGISLAANEIWQIKLLFGLETV